MDPNGADEPYDFEEDEYDASGPQAKQALLRKQGIVTYVIPQLLGLLPQGAGLELRLHWGTFTFAWPERAPYGPCKFMSTGCFRPVRLDLSHLQDMLWCTAGQIAARSLRRLQALPIVLPA